MNEIQNEICEFLQKNKNAVLSTHSFDVEGYPFGSVTPFSLDKNLTPVILISSLAQHTKNIKNNPHVCLTILEESDGQNQQAKGRLSILANAQLVKNPDEVKSFHFERFPESQGYFGTHDFDFYRLEPVRLRYIAGFGKISWIEPKDLFPSFLPRSI